jgi:hypothetical protein
MERVGEEEMCVLGFGGSSEVFLWERLIVQYGSIDINKV